MNSLVGLGATASFAVSCVAAGLPALRWKTFFEEPAMLLGGLTVGSVAVVEFGTFIHGGSYGMRVHLLATQPASRAWAVLCMAHRSHGERCVWVCSPLLTVCACCSNLCCGCRFCAGGPCT